MFCIGADLGQAVDYTAIAVIEKTDWLDLRHIERIPLGQSYTSIAGRLARLQTSLPGSRLVIDNTGVGRPVADMLTELGVKFIGVSITSGKEAKLVDGVWRVPKELLMQKIAAVFDAKQLRIAKSLPGADVLIAELADFEYEITEAGNVIFNGKTEHDDLVIAAALAVWAT